MEKTKKNTRNIEKVKRKKKLNKKRIMAVAGGVALVCAVTFGFKLLKNVVGGDAGLTDTYKLEFYTNDKYVSNDKFIVYTQNDQIKGVNKKGKEKFAITDAKDVLGVKISSKYFAYYTENEYKVFDMNGRPMTSFESKDKISDLRITNENVIFVKTDETGVSKLVVHDMKTSEVYSMDVDADTVGDFGIISSSETLWVLNIDKSISTPLCTFSSYGLKKNSTYNVINIPNQMVDKLYVTNNNIYAVGTSDVAVYDVSGVKETTDMVYGWKLADVKFEANKPTFVFVPRGEETFSNVRVKHSSGEEYTFALQEPCFESIISDKYIYSFSNNNAFYSDLKGENTKKVELSSKIIDAKSVLDGDSVIVDDGKCYTLLSLE